MITKRLLARTAILANLLAAILFASPALAQDSSTPAPPQTEPPAQRTLSAAEVQDNLATVSPLSIIYVITEYWTGGDKLKAAFWYYIWQIRTQAWVGSDSGFDQFRTTMNNEMGSTINGWIGADPVVWREVAERAASYEAKLPLWRVHPENMTEEAWLAQIAATRADYAKQMTDAFDSTTPDAMRASRTAANLPVGPLTDSGAPLPEEWQ